MLQEIIGDYVMQKKNAAQDYQYDSPADDGFILLLQCFRSFVRLQALANHGLRASVRVEHCIEHENKRAEYEYTVNLAAHHYQSRPNGKICNGFQVFAVVDRAQARDDGADCSSSGRIGGQPEAFDSGSPLCPFYQAILAIRFALYFMCAFGAERFAACAAGFLRFNCRMI